MSRYVAAGMGGNPGHIDTAIHKWYRDAGNICNTIAGDPEKLLDAMAADGILVKDHDDSSYAVPHEHNWGIRSAAPINGAGPEILVKWGCWSCGAETYGPSVVAKKPGE